MSLETPLLSGMGTQINNATSIPLAPEKKTGIEDSKIGRMQHLEDEVRRLTNQVLAEKEQSVQLLREMSVIRQKGDDHEREKRQRSHTVPVNFEHKHHSIQAAPHRHRKTTTDKRKGTFTNLFNLFESKQRSPLTDTRDSRLISRERGKDGKINITYTHRRNRLNYLYVQMIDITWTRLFMVYTASYMMLNLVLAILFMIQDETIIDADVDITFADAFFFVVQTMDTIGYGVMSPTGLLGNWLVVFTSIVANFYWAAWTGIIFVKISRPSHLRFAFRFSNVACLNHSEAVYDNLHEFKGKYVTGYPSLSFRIADQRPCAVICDGALNLLYFHCKQRPDGSDEFIMHEMDFELNRQRGRVRTMNMSTPLLSIPWKVVHKIDETSPLFGKSISDIKRERGEIIGVVDGIDENTSENYQARWSYCAEEILYNEEFVECIYYERVGRNERLHCDLSKLSETRSKKQSSILT